MATFGAAYNNTKIKDEDLSVVPCGSTLCEAYQWRDENGQVSIDGNPFPRTPKTNYTFTLRYGMPVSDDGELFIYTDWVYYGDIQMALYYTPEFQTSAQYEGGLRIGYRNTTQLKPFRINCFESSRSTNRSSGKASRENTAGEEGSFQRAHPIATASAKSRSLAHRVESVDGGTIGL